MALLSCWSGIVLALILIKMTGVKSGLANLAMAILGGVIGGYIGNKMNHLVKCVSTAFVGAFLTVRGAGMFAPESLAYPSELHMKAVMEGSDLDHSHEFAIWLYLGGLFVLTVAGSMV